MLDLRYYEQTGLRKADCFATCAGDPYAVVFRDGHKLGRTPSQDSTTHPVWDEKTYLDLLTYRQIVQKGDPDYFEPKSSSWFRRRRPKKKKEEAEDSSDDDAAEGRR